MRTKLICPDCGHKNYSVESFCQKCSGRLDKAKVTTSAASFIGPKTVDILTINSRH